MTSDYFINLEENPYKLIEDVILRDPKVTFW